MSPTENIQGVFFGSKIFPTQFLGVFLFPKVNPKTSRLREIFWYQKTSPWIVSEGEPPDLTTHKKWLFVEIKKTVLYTLQKIRHL